MKTLQIFILIFIIFIMIFSCTEKPILNFNPPTGNDWILNKDKNSVLFRKEINKEKHYTVIVFARLTNTNTHIKTIQELLQYAEQKYHGVTRYKNVDLKLSIVNFGGKDFVRADFTSEDHGAPDIPPGTFLTMKGYDYYSLIPENKKFIIHSGYSQRFLPGVKPIEAIEKEVEPFLKSIVFIYERNSVTSLIKASKNGDIRSVKALIVKGVDINAKGSVSDWGKTALMEASQRGHIDIVQALIKAGANVSAKDIYGDTALLFATEKGGVKIVKILLSAKADVNIQNISHGSTALMVAARNSHAEITNILLDAGADVNIKDNEGLTALSIVVMVGSGPIVQALIKNNAGINIKDNIGRTPLMLAAINAHTLITQLLIEKGADVNTKTILELERGNFEITALKIAEEKGYLEIVELLKKAGARE